MAQLALASFRPRIDAQIDAYLAKPTDELDAILGTIGATVLAFRSDDAEPVTAAVGIPRLPEYDEVEPDPVH